MAWITPKTDWIPSDAVADTDLNRIEGNIAVLGQYGNLRHFDKNVLYIIERITGKWILSSQMLQFWDYPGKTRQEIMDSSGFPFNDMALVKRISLVKYNPFNVLDFYIDLAKGPFLTEGQLTCFVQMFYDGERAPNSDIIIDAQDLYACSPYPVFSTLGKTVSISATSNPTIIDIFIFFRKLGPPVEWDPTGYFKNIDAKLREEF